MTSNNQNSDASQTTGLITALQLCAARLQSLLELSSDVFWELDETYCHTLVTAIRGATWTVEDALGKPQWHPLFGCEPAEGSWDDYRALLNAQRPFREFMLKRQLPDGRVLRYYALSANPIRDDHGVFRGYRGVSKEITESKLAEERIQYLATHDSLTSLPNRVMFNETLSLAVEHARRYQNHFAVLFIDLDRFKVINDSLNHEAGDQLLQQIGIRLRQTVRASDVVARLGGDEFVVLIQEVSEPTQAAAAARKILSTILKPAVVAGQECRITASIGICLYPSDADDEQALLRNADIAMYRAKENGKNTFQFYSEDIKTQSLERLALETSLRHALERGEFLLHYQAKLDLRAGKITGVEALLRWHHPDLGMVLPGQFIPLAEETGLIVPIGQWVLKTACAQNVAWQQQGLPPVRVAVNLSARQFADENLLTDIANALSESGMAPELLELELTESMVMQNHERASKVLAALKRLGVQLAIDDFGVGYSSLAQIKQFPFDTLKVDRTFIRDLPDNSEDRAITKAVIAMAKSLNLTVVAEGVETIEQETFLRDHACDETQGYYFSRPIAAEQFGELLREHNIAIGN